MRYLFAVITFAVLGALLLLFLGWRVTTPQVVPPPAPIESNPCPPPTTTQTVPGPTTTVTVPATHAVWLQRGCPGDVLPSS
ncbi:hypothetical protein GCM10022222_42540 [Amycolatopsis ultiminotia]|uniref:Uncharacterized protein n=1 Tax=Amycolatopsis ultiminotia TaxID=543629 RepID=A0ABP6WRG1_9PSEU